MNLDMITVPMVERFLKHLVSPVNFSELVLKANILNDSDGNEFPVVNSIPRFVEPDNYSSSFGYQWNIFSSTQLDQKNRHGISRDRFYRSTRWTDDELKGKDVLEVGSGSGRFTQVALGTGATLYSVDYSNAVEANFKNNGSADNLFLCQASVYDMPFKYEFFDKIFCLGVIQHTPDVELSFKKMLRHLKIGGEIVIDVYADSLKTKFYSKYWVRPLTKKIDKDKLLCAIRWYVPKWMPVSTALLKIPYLGKFLAQVVPVCNYTQQFPHLSKQELIEWAVLDTFDMLSPEYDNPQKLSTLEKWVSKYNLQNIYCGKGDNGYVLIAKKTEKCVE